MGACFQAPCATPGQRQMETPLCLTFLTFHRYPHHYCNVLRFNVGGCLEPFTISCKNNNNDDNNNKFWQKNE